MELSSSDFPPPFKTEPVDPLSIARHAGGSGDFYERARIVPDYGDGVVLAYAVAAHSDPEALWREYEALKDDPAFHMGEFVASRLVVPPLDSHSYAAAPGQSIHSYRLEARNRLIVPNMRQDFAGSKDLMLAGVGRFPEGFGWDWPHQANGLRADGDWTRILDITNNMEFQINRYGHLLNGTNDFYVTRPQPDYFAHMVRMVAEEFGSGALVRYKDALEKNYHDYWMGGEAALLSDGETHVHRALVRMPDGSLLNRYWDDADGPRIESYKEDIETAELAVRDLPEGEKEAARQKIYKHLRSGAASGHDYSARWFKDSKNLHTIKTADIAPMDLNSLLYYHEETLALACEASVDEETNISKRNDLRDQAADYRKRAENRKNAIDKYLWDSTAGKYRDYDFVDKRQMPITSSAMTYPLFVGAANLEQSTAVMDSVRHELLHPGGVISTTVHDSGQQWDGMNVWAPLNWSAARGFAQTAHAALARGFSVKKQRDVEWLLRTSEEVRERYLRGNEMVFNEYGIIPEKLRGDDPTQLAGGGEYALVPVLGMSLETYRAMQHYDPRDPVVHLGWAANTLVTAARRL